MKNIALLRIRYFIIFLTIVIIALDITYFLYIHFYFHSLIYFYWDQISIFTILPITFLSYVYSIRCKPFLDKHIRAFILLAIAVFWLYININNINLRYQQHIPFICGSNLKSNDILCTLSRSMELISIICAFFMILEIYLSFKYGPVFYKSVDNIPQQQQVLYVSPVQPLPFLQQQPQYTQLYPNTYYPQQQQQTYQQQFYQTQPQQQLQQSHPYVVQGHRPVQRQVPGSMITTVPQCSGSPIIPYPSPGHSIAVSPVLPPGGYSPESSSHSPTVQPIV